MAQPTRRPPPPLSAPAAAGREAAAQVRLGLGGCRSGYAEAGAHLKKLQKPAGWPRPDAPPTCILGRGEDGARGAAESRGSPGHGCGPATAPQSGDFLAQTPPRVGAALASPRPPPPSGRTQKRRRPRGRPHATAAAGGSFMTAALALAQSQPRSGRRRRARAPRPARRVPAGRGRCPLPRRESFLGPGVRREPPPHVPRSPPPLPYLGRLRWRLIRDRRRFLCRQRLRGCAGGPGGSPVPVLRGGRLGGATGAHGAAPRPYEAADAVAEGGGRWRRSRE